MIRMHLRPAVLRSVAVIGVALLNAGCFSYTNSAPAQTAPGTRVAVNLTTRAAADFTDQLGGTIDRVEGVLMWSNADSARIQVERTRLLAGGWAYWGRESVTLPMSASASWQRRSFSKKRTALAAGGLILIGIQIWTNGLLGAFGYDPDQNPRPLPPVNPG